MFPAKSDSRRRLNAGAGSSAGGDYVKVEDHVDGFVNEQWTVPNIEEPTPWKIITIILSLFTSGTVCRERNFLIANLITIFRIDLHDLCSNRLVGGPERRTR